MAFGLWHWKRRTQILRFLIEQKGRGRVRHGGQAIGDLPMYGTVRCEDATRVRCTVDRERSQSEEWINADGGAIWALNGHRCGKLGARGLGRCYR